MALPRNQFLPGMENTEIATLEQKADELDTLRVQRQQLGMLEETIKEDIKELMKQFSKSHYRRGKFEIDLGMEEVLTVKIHKEKAESDGE